MIHQFVIESLKGLRSFMVRTGEVLLFLLITLLSGVLIAFPLWKMALDLTLFYNLLVLILILLLVIRGGIKRIQSREPGDLLSLLFLLGGSALFYLIFIIPEKFGLYGLLLVFFYQGGLVLLKIKSSLSRKLFIFLSLLGVLLGIYWFSWLWDQGWPFPALFAGLIFLILEGFLLYDKKSLIV